MPSPQIGPADARRGIEATQGQLVRRSGGLAFRLENRDFVDLAVLQPEVGGLFGSPGRRADGIGRGTVVVPLPLAPMTILPSTGV